MVFFLSSHKQEMSAPQHILWAALFMSKARGFLGGEKKEDYVFIQKLNEINNFESNLQIAISHCNEGQKKKDTLAIESLPFL